MKAVTGIFPIHEAAPLDGPWPLVARESEFGRLVEAVRSGSALVMGATGVGKTRLIEELHRRIVADGVNVWRLTATHTSSAIPLGAVAPLLDDQRIGVQQALADAHAIADRLERDVVMIDDAHLLDNPSATLIHHLIQLNAKVVAAVRSDAATPDAVLAVARDGLAARVDVNPLAPEAFRVLLNTILGAHVDDATLRQIYRMSGGNLIYLRELVLNAIDSGSLVRERDIWRLDASIGASPGLTQLVTCRLSGLTEQHRELLELIAVTEPMSLCSAEHLIGADGLTALEAMGLATLVRSGRRHQVRLSHPVYGEVLRERMSAVRRVALHRVAAEQLEQTPLRRRDDIVRVAIHRLEGGGAIDGDVLTEAAQRAIVTGDPELGARLARVAITGGERAFGGLLLAEALTALGRHLEVEAALNAAWAAAEDDDHVALIALRRALLAFWVLNDADEADRALDAAEHRISDRELLDEIDAQRATFSLLRAEFDDAVSRARPLIAQSSGRPRIVAAVASAPALALQGHGEEALQVAASGHASLLERGPVLVMSTIALPVAGRLLALQELGRLDQARAEGRNAYDDAVESEDTDSQGWLALMMGRTELATGQLGAAGRWFDEAAAVFSSLGYPALERWSRAGRVLVDAWRGDPVVSRSAELLAMCDPGPTVMMEVEVLRSAAWSAAATKDVSTAVKLLREGMDLARAQGALALESACAHDLLRVSGSAPAERLAELATEIDGELASARAEHAAAAQLGDGTRLLAVSEHFEQLGAVLLAAEAAAQAGAAFASTGEGSRARSVWRQSQRLEAMTEGAHTPLLGLRGESSCLTRRELEVARLAATGATNAEIAQRLYISQRTVENHLQRTYEKLGVHSREDLRDALAPTSSAA